MRPDKSNVDKLAELCRQVGYDLVEMRDAFGKLEDAIKAEGYQVIWYMHSNSYSLRKLEK